MAYDDAPRPSEYDPFYGNYIARVPPGDIVAILATQMDDTIALVRELTDEQALHAYAPGKWSIKQVLGHMCDAERIFTTRALRFARADETPLAGFEENAYVEHGGFNERPLASLIAELSAVRRASVALYAHLQPAQFTRGGTANSAHATVRALAWITAGHELHHRAILAERYLDAGLRLRA